MHVLELITSQSDTLVFHFWFPVAGHGCRSKWALPHVTPWRPIPCLARCIFIAGSSSLSCCVAGLQEYLGSFTADESGRLRFREGALVTALRLGQWLVLDELNLAPTEVLEALNRRVLPAPRPATTPPACRRGAAMLLVCHVGWRRQGARLGVEVMRPNPLQCYSFPPTVERRGSATVGLCFSIAKI